MKNNICPFCDKEQNYRYVAVGKYAKIIYPKSPASEYHLLITPIRHIEHIDNLKTEEVLEIFEHLQKLVIAGESNIVDFAGYNILSNNGTEHVNQRVAHCHLHVFLRTSDDQDPIRATHSKHPEPLTLKQRKALSQIKQWLSQP